MKIEKMAENLKERAYVLINVHSTMLNSVCANLKNIDKVVMVDIVYGPYDVIVVIEAANIKDITKIVLVSIRGIEGITETLTCIRID